MDFSFLMDLYSSAKESKGDEAVLYLKKSANLPEKKDFFGLVFAYLREEESRKILPEDWK
jgi:hypothetical protein